MNLLPMQITRLLAPNPGVFTGPGTNTYVLASAGKALVLDPGPLIDAHMAAIQAAVAELEPVGVAVTHTHPDHAPAANPLAAALGVPAYGFGPGPGFVPMMLLRDGDTLPIGDEEAAVLHTPGHTADHLCFLVGDALFTGDHLMGGSTVIIEDLTAYLDSLRKLQPLALSRLYPGHGPEIEDPQALIAEYIAHRLDRERQVQAALAEGAGTVGEVVTAVYEGLDPALRHAAAWSVAAHLRKLGGEGTVEFEGAAEWGAPVRLIEEAT
jgi:glyoxylase-like metal-dependent hydrolase (beta-lactamase superfamily II)